ncbi:MAG: Zeta toxin family protein [Thiomonas sp. 14-64-326]|jgi:predicted ABC-type ATPase|uniref:AAA family ATPase n=1 Tax=Thiomonas sp. TaxID=2047785 RepID=UPI000BCBB2AC|nr:AAA family ATPase [Thiomonas sp.]OZB74141.1 MAG: Zeta toxin family protein [Thiomonas sp. 14-64-326]
MNLEHRILLIAGPNGAGKTTFAKIFLPEADYSDFINADLIASGLSPFDPDRAARRAARLMLEEIDLRVKNGKSFALETTLSGRGYAAQIPRWHALGYHAKLVFLSLPDAEMAVQRVAARVAQGGHAIPEAVIRRRFSAGLLNFHHLYKPLVNAWALYDNSGDLPSLISSGDNP